MDPVYNTRCNLTLTAPGCADLPAQLSGEEPNLMISTYWIPSAEEKALLVAGGRVKLTILGASHPPVRIDVDPPNRTEPPP